MFHGWFILDLMFRSSNMTFCKLLVANIDFEDVVTVSFYYQVLTWFPFFLDSVSVQIWAAHLWRL